MQGDDLEQIKIFIFVLMALAGTYQLLYSNFK